MVDATALQAEAAQLIRVLGPPPGDVVTECDEGIEHWTDRHEMAADILALVARFEAESLRLAALSLKDGHLDQLALLGRAVVKVREGGSCQI